MRDFWVRPFSEGDAGACAALFYDAVQTGAVEKYTKGQRDAWCGAVPDAGEFGEFLARQDSFVAEGTELLGFMSLDGDLLDMAYVHPNQRGQGIADALYSCIVNHALVSGQSRVHTNTSLYARSFFDRQGWQVDQSNDLIRGTQVLRRFAMSKGLKP